MDYLCENITNSENEYYVHSIVMRLTVLHCFVHVYFSAKEAFERRISPIIIDNTNIQAWEMKPYVTLVSITI